MFEVLHKGNTANHDLNDAELCKFQMVTTNIFQFKYILTLEIYWYQS